MKYATIEGFTSLDKQELFDRAARHVLSNGRPSIKGTTCQYGGIGCAAAPFLRLEERDHMDEYQAQWSELVKHRQVPPHEADFVGALQDAHDDYRQSTDFVKDYRAAMLRLANRYALDVGVLG